MLTCPNGKGFDFEILGILNDSVDHEHLNYFNPHSITMLLEKCGFELLETRVSGKLDVELVKRKINENEFDVFNQHLLKKNIY